MVKNQNEAESVIGLISDTHGLVRPEAIEALTGVDQILHAGDIGNSDVLNTLQRTASVVAVRGNNDTGEWARKLVDSAVVKVGTVTIYLIHNLKEMELNPVAAGFHVVVSGHSHKPSVETSQGVLYVNPGSAGPRRFTLPVSVARLRICGQHVSAELVDLGIGSNGRSCQRFS